MTAATELWPRNPALADRLPPYMIPAAVVALHELPLTVNGKLDTRALPAPEYTGGEYRAPANAVEEILADIYAEVLGAERVGIDESFFELGGDSILSMQVVARARAAGLVCRPRDVFVEQTVAALARVVTVADGVRPFPGGRPRAGRRAGPRGGLHDRGAPLGAGRVRHRRGAASLAGPARDVAVARRRRRCRRVVVYRARAGVGGCA